MPGDEVMLEYHGGRLTLKQSGGVSGEFTGPDAAKLMQVAIGQSVR